jgi:PhnB protein
MATDSWIRSGYHSVNPYLVADSPVALIAWLCEVFDCTERGVREIASDGRISHAEMQLGDSVVMFSEASRDHPARPSVNFVYVPDVDSVYRRAVTARATKLHEPQDWPWGDRVAGFHDPADNRWWVATCLQDSPNGPDQ